ncbi:MAG TPA: M20/M25/M40 family metallo-hydrolase [Gemmatimonadaceae bacterium]|nr:M20/M25/M40 family metallo-hydrolase [Gemmatimonadaceae bacterium]
MRFSSTLLFASALAGCASLSTPGASTSPALHPSPDSGAISRIIAEGTRHSHVRDDLEYLTDVIGPRLTGSPEMQRANDWTARRFREYGMDSSWTEPWTFGIGWSRGPMTLTMLAPQHRQLIGYSWAWAPGTNGPVAGDVVFLDARTEASFHERFAGKLRGAWVMLGPAAPIANPDGPPMTAADSARLDSLRRAQFRLTEEERRFMGRRTELLAGEGIAGVIRDGAKEFGLLTMSGSPNAVSPVPYIVIPHGDYDQFERLLQRGEHVRLEADIHNSFTSDTLLQRNTVAEIRGTQHPDEVVLLGAHLDSWDLGTGATDNGAGAIGVLEAARILKASGVRPARSIRFVLFSGEEEGLLGSRAYARAHAAELPKYQAVLVLDNGTGRITGMALQGRDELATLWQQLLAPVASLGPFHVRSANKGGTDHLSFLPYGVPGFNFDQATAGYNHTHHSQVDVFDHAIPGDLAQAATVMAATAYELADLPALLPRNPAEQR